MLKYPCVVAESGDALAPAPLFVFLAVAVAATVSSSCCEVLYSRFWHLSVAIDQVRLEAMQQQTAPPHARRQFERTEVIANAFVHCHGRFQPAKIMDYSQGGLQLVGTFGLLKRDPLLVEFLSGISIVSMIAWSFGGKTGVVFLQPLPVTHPAIIELSRKAAVFQSGVDRFRVGR